MRTWYTNDGRAVKLTENMENALVRALHEGTGTVTLGRSALSLKNRGLAQDVAGWSVLTKDGRHVAKLIEIDRRQARDTTLEGEPEPAPKAPEYRPTPEITAQDRVDVDPGERQIKVWRGRHGLGTQYLFFTGEQIADAIEADHTEALEIEAELQAEADRRLDLRKQVDWRARYGIQYASDWGHIRRAVEADHAEALAMNGPQIKGEVTTAAELKESADRVERLARALRAAVYEVDTFDLVQPGFQERWRNAARLAIAEIEGPAVPPNTLKVGDLVWVGKSPARYQVTEVEGDRIRVRVASHRHNAGWYASWMVRRA